MEENSEVHLNVISLYPYLCFFSLTEVKNIEKMKLLFKEKKNRRKNFIQLFYTRTCSTFKERSEKLRFSAGNSHSCFNWQCWECFLFALSERVLHYINSKSRKTFLFSPVVSVFHDSFCLSKFWTL